MRYKTERHLLKKRKDNLEVSQIGMKDDLKAKTESLLGQQVEKVQMEWEVWLQRSPSGNGMNLASHVSEQQPT